MIYNEEELTLGELEDDTLATIIALEEREKSKYIRHLIEQYFPKVEPDSEEYSHLQLSYRTGFLIEHLYRNNALLQECFTIVYTKQGLIRDVVNDLYFTDDHLITH